MDNRFLLLLILAAFFSIALTQKKTNPQPKDSKPIKAIMQLLVMDMQTIEFGIWNENFETIQTGAENIVDHPKIPDSQRKEIAGILGPEMKAFAAFDKQVHSHADSLAEDAAAKNMKEVLRHYSIIQQGCVSCHANLRTKIIEGR